MNKEQQIIDEAYKNYLDRLDTKFREADNKMIGKRDALRYGNIDYTQEEFINKCKTNPEFSKRWGLQIEERELSQRERCKLLSEAWKQNGIPPEHEEVSTLWVEYNNLMEKYDIPTKLITVTYKDKTIESYE